MKRLLIVSNGHGEDLEAGQIVRAFPPGAVAVSALPLVGLGRAYPPEVALLDPRRDFPSGGFGARAGLASLWADLRAGWLRFWRAQRATLRAQHDRTDLVLAAGDAYCLWMAAVPRRPVVYLELPKSEYVGPHSVLERRLIRRFAREVFTRDEVTAGALRRHGIPAQYVGFTLMDAMAPSGETFGLPAGQPVLTLLPGSRTPALANLPLLLQAAAGAAASVEAPPAVLVAWAPHLPAAALRETVAACGGRWTDARRFLFEAHAGARDPSAGRASRPVPIEVTVATEHFADALACATVVLGMAGAAHEQAAGLGKPIVAFPGRGSQFTAAFLREQARLLGDALVAVESVEEASRAAAALLRDPAERDRRGRIGRERQGGPGGAAAIAQALLARLAA